MFKIKKKKHEVAIRVYLESDLYGREFFDSSESVEECAAAVARIAASALAETLRDNVGRQVGIAVVPKTEYGWGDEYGDGLDDE